jgi:hypothetical protein
MLIDGTSDIQRVLNERKVDRKEKKAYIIMEGRK